MPAGVSKHDIPWIGFGNGLAGNIAAVASGRVMDGWLRRRLKLGIMIGLIGAFASTGWFMLQLPCFGAAALLPRSEMTLVLAVVLNGFFQVIIKALLQPLPSAAHTRVAHTAVVHVCQALP